MRPLPVLLLLLMMALTSCSDLPEKRRLLASAGSETIPATTPAQLARLNSIKSNKVVPVNGKRGTAYLFADKQKKCLMIGGASQYQKYRTLKIRQQQIDAKLLDAQVNMDDADYNTWGPGADWGWGVASAPL